MPLELPSQSTISNGSIKLKLKNLFSNLGLNWENYESMYPKVIFPPASIPVKWTREVPDTQDDSKFYDAYVAKGLNRQNAKALKTALNRSGTVLVRATSSYQLEEVIEELFYYWKDTGKGAAEFKDISFQDNPTGDDLLRELFRLSKQSEEVPHFFVKGAQKLLPPRPENIVVSFLNQNFSKNLTDLIDPKSFSATSLQQAFQSLDEITSGEATAGELISKTLNYFRVYLPRDSGERFILDILTLFSNQDLQHLRSLAALSEQTVDSVLDWIKNKTVHRYRSNPTLRSYVALKVSLMGKPVPLNGISPIGLDSYLHETFNELRKHFSKTETIAQMITKGIENSYHNETEALHELAHQNKVALVLLFEPDDLRSDQWISNHLQDFKAPVVRFKPETEASLGRYLNSLTKDTSVRFTRNAKRLLLKATGGQPREIYMTLRELPVGLFLIDENAIRAAIKKARNGNTSLDFRL